MWKFLFLWLLALVFACTTEPSYSSCHMPAGMVKDCTTKALSEECKNFGLDCLASCMVEDHPECNGDVCMIYNYKDPIGSSVISSPAFCTFECTPPEDEKGNIPADWDHKAPECGDSALCMPYLDKYYCIPQKYLKKQENN